MSHSDEKKNRNVQPELSSKSPLLGAQGLALKAEPLAKRQLSNEPLQKSMLNEASTAAVKMPLASHHPIKIDSSQLNLAWRQLLPLLPQKSELDFLNADFQGSDLPPPVTEFLQQIRQQLPNPLSSQLGKELPQQLQALLQFSPLTPPPLSAQPTAATGLAVAMQLLLGRLSGSNALEKNSPKDIKLKELVQQIDLQQSSELLKKLSSQSATFQQAQLSTLEQQSKEPLQQLYFSLPLATHQQSNLCEIAITERESEHHAPKNSASSWQLTMKFDLKILGNLLAISTLSEKTLSLQLYTDNTTALLLAERFLPILAERLTAQGIELTETRCQLGKIPDSLLPRTTSLIAVRI